jgi:hypothetical protein
MKKSSLIRILTIGIISLPCAGRDPSTRGWGALAKGFEEGMEYGQRSQEIENQKRAIEAENNIRELDYQIKMQQLENEKLKGRQLRKALEDTKPFNEK